MTPDNLDAETAEVCFFDYEVKPGDVVVDVGAGIGTEIGAFSKRATATGRVIAIEAHPATFGCLEQTIRLNKFSNVAAVFAALSETNGTLTISDDEDRHYANSVVAGSGTISVPSFAFDSLAQLLGIDHIDFLKMNIEGAETMALQGMPQLLQRTRRVCISCHDFKADQGFPEQYRTRKHVVGLLKEYGFELRFRKDERPDMSHMNDYVYGTNLRYQETAVG